MGKSPLGAVVNVQAVVNVKDVDNSAGLVDPVDDAISAAPGAVAASERPEQRLADPVRVACKPGIAKLQHSGSNGFRKPVGDRSPRGRLEPDLVPLRRFGRHAPVARRRARSWRTVAMSTPGSPLPRAARLSEIRATASISPRISKVISKPSRSSTDSKTASASPLRVRVIRSCCWRTRLASSERRALASDNDTDVAAIVIVRIIDHTGLILDQSWVGKAQIRSGVARRFWPAARIVQAGSNVACRASSAAWSGPTNGDVSGCQVVHAPKRAPSRTSPQQPGLERVSAGQSLFSRRRRMRDSNPRGRNPTRFPNPQAEVQWRSKVYVHACETIDWTLADADKGRQLRPKLRPRHDSHAGESGPRVAGAPPS